MIQASIPIRFICFLVAILSLLTSTPQVNAGVRVSMADDLEPGRHFLVTTTIFNRGFDGFFTERLDSSFLTSGERKDITVLAVKPFLYDRVSADALHPGYYYDSTRSDEVPFALRTVVLPALRPPSWRLLLDSGEPPKGQSGGSIPFSVNQHFETILRVYLPAFDRARIKEDLRQYVPLLCELAALAHRERVYKKSAVAVAPAQGPIPLQEEEGESLRMTMERYRGELGQQLKEIKAWLALEQSKRAPMHDWVVHFHKADYVYREMMTDADRNRIQQWLGKSHGPSRERTLRWANADTGLSYTLYLNTGIRGEFGSGYRTDLIVDLNPILGLENNQRYLKKNYLNFYRNAEGLWGLK